MKTAQKQIISRIPQKGMSGEQWGIVVENELIKIWVEAMAPVERESFEKGNLTAMTPASFAKLDRIIIEQAKTLGWRIGLSELVRFRFSEWDHDPIGPELQRKYGLACARSASIMH